MANHGHTFHHNDRLEVESPVLPEEPARRRFLQGMIASTAPKG